MRRLAVAAFALVLLTAPVLCSAAEEELFDTKAAVKYLEQGISHLKAKNLDEAVNALEESVSIAPEAEAYYYLGYAYYLKGRSGDSESRKKSIENFEKAYELDPNFTPTRYKPAPESSEPEAEQKTAEPQDAITPPSGPAKQLLDAATPSQTTDSVAKQSR